MDARETNDIGNSLESPSLDLAQIKRKYIVNSKSTLQNVLTEYGLPSPRFLTFNTTLFTVRDLPIEKSGA